MMIKQEGDSPERKQLKRDLARAELTRIEESARTVEEFENVGELWDKRDDNRERRERRYEQSVSNNMFDWKFEDWVAYEENFLNLIYSCICEMHLLTDELDISRLVNKATKKQKTVFFPRVITRCSTATIAHCHGMTDRNVRKLIDLMVDNIRRDLFTALQARFDKKEPMTLRQMEFLQTYVPKEKKSTKKKEGTKIGVDKDNAKS